MSQGGHGDRSRPTKNPRFLGTRVLTATSTFQLGHFAPSEIPFRPAIIMTVAFGALLTCVLMPLGRTGRMEHAGRSNIWCRYICAAFHSKFLLSQQKQSKTGDMFFYVYKKKHDIYNDSTRNFCITRQDPKKFPPNKDPSVRVSMLSSETFKSRRNRFLPLYEFTTQLQTKTAENLGKMRARSPRGGHGG